MTSVTPLHVKSNKQAGLNTIGLNAETAQQLSAQLNELLANYQIFYMNVRGYHWNIAGDDFFELHAKFEEVYNDLLIKIDEIAERVLTLGHTPLHAYSDYLKVSSIKEHTNATTTTETVSGLLDGFVALLPLLRKIQNAADDAGDDATDSLMGDYIKEHEKLVWMLTAYLKK